MNAACPRRVSLIIASGLPAIPSPTICGSAGTVPAVAGLSRRDRLRLALADSPNLADRIEFTATIRSDSLCYGLVVLSPLLSTPHCCDAVTVRYRTALHRTETDSHRSIPSPSQAHERRLAAGFGRPFRPNGWKGTTVCDHRELISRSQTGAPGCVRMRPAKSGDKLSPPIEKSPADQLAHLGGDVALTYE